MLIRDFAFSMLLRDRRRQLHQARAEPRNVSKREANMPSKATLRNRSKSSSDITIVAG